jgi:hypothetical protein
MTKDEDVVNKKPRELTDAELKIVAGGIVGGSNVVGGSNSGSRVVGGSN